MKQLHYKNNIYQTIPKKISLFAKAFPAVKFYSQFLLIVFKASRKAKCGRYSNPEWCKSSFGTIRSLESVGVNFEITGINFLEQLDTSCVVIANHMSMLETVILPIIIQPVKDVTFIVKQALLDYPVFKHIMRSRDPIAVSRINPRLDLKAVLEGGTDRLKEEFQLLYSRKRRAQIFLIQKSLTQLVSSLLIGRMHP